MADVAFTVFSCDLRLDLHAQPFGQHPHHLPDRRPLAHADVDRLVIGAIGFERQQVGLNDVADVNEIARLPAIFIDYRLLVVQQARREYGADACIRIRERLARSVNVEITQRDHRYAVSPPDYQAELLLVLLGDGVDRSWKQRLLFAGPDRRQGRSGLRAYQFPSAFRQLTRRANRRVYDLAVGIAIRPFTVYRH